MKSRPFDGALLEARRALEAELQEVVRALRKATPAPGRALPPGSGWAMRLLVAAAAGFALGHRRRSGRLRGSSEDEAATRPPDA